MIVITRQKPDGSIAYWKTDVMSPADWVLLTEEVKLSFVEISPLSLGTWVGNAHDVIQQGLSPYFVSVGMQPQKAATPKKPKPVRTRVYNKADSRVPVWEDI